MLQGSFVELISVRPAIKIKSKFGWIMSTIALGIIFKNVAENIWGRDALPFPAPLPMEPIPVANGVAIAKSNFPEITENNVPPLATIARTPSEVAAIDLVGRSV